MKIKRVYNVLPSKDKNRDWRLSSAGLPDGFSTPSTIPAAVDLRAPWWTVGNQGSTGACVGFAVGDGLCRWHFKTAGKINEYTKISWRQIWMSSKEEDTVWRPASHIDSWGTYVKDALDIPRKYGVVTQSFWPSSSKTYTGTYERFYSEASKLRIAAYYNLGGGMTEEWKYWLASQGPIVVRLDVDRQFKSVSYGQTTPLDNYVPGNVMEGHAVCLVGYDSTAGTFTVRNSWGTRWGMDGHVYVTENYARSAFDEAYGITL